MRALTERSEGIKSPPTVAKMFFGGNPAFNRELYEAVHREMERDYSPTYWFRVMRAQQLLDLYRRDPAAFQSLAETYRYDPDPAQRAPHRLAVWLKRDDLVFQNCEDLRREQGRKLQKVLDDPNRFNFSVRKDLIGANDLRNQEFYLQASPAALGTLVYISYETRKLFEEMNRRGQKWVPIDVTSLRAPARFDAGLFGEGAKRGGVALYGPGFRHQLFAYARGATRGAPVRPGRHGMERLSGLRGRERAQRNNAHRRGAVGTRVLHVRFSGSHCSGEGVSAAVRALSIPSVYRRH